jgi:hypothetical protein
LRQHSIQDTEWKFPVSELKIERPGFSCLWVTETVAASALWLLEKMMEYFALPNSLQRLTGPDDSRKSAGVMRAIWNEGAILADKPAPNRVFLIAKHRRIPRLALTVLSARWEHRRRLRRERAPARAVRTVVA